jgi:hypothetical protein
MQGGVGSSQKERHTKARAKLLPWGLGGFPQKRRSYDKRSESRSQKARSTTPVARWVHDHFRAQNCRCGPLHTNQTIEPKKKKFHLRMPCLRLLSWGSKSPSPPDPPEQVQGPVRLRPPEGTQTYRHCVKRPTRVLGIVHRNFITTLLNSIITS